MQTHMLVSHIFHTAQTDQYPRTYPLILTYSYISRRWDKWNEVFQGEEISRFIHKHLPFSTVILKRWHHRSKRIFTNVIIHFGRTFLTPLKQCHKHCSTHKPVIVITNVLFNGMRDYAFIHTEHYVQIEIPPSLWVYSKTMNFNLNFNLYSCIFLMSFGKLTIWTI